ncbi:NAD(+)/NADH kinase [Candidatus Zixiibacteriota bacterium]
MKFGLIANMKRRGAKEAVQSFMNWAEKNKHVLILTDDLKDHFQNYTSFQNRSNISNEVDVLVTMGGDGTLLSSARAVGSSGIPILGINLGSLGFLTQLTPQQLQPALDAIIKGDYNIEKRMVLKAESEGLEKVESPYALNDIVIDNGPVSRLIDINLSVNDENIVTYKADGLIIATPTGSTAYSLAVGGPILHPKMEAIIASPISCFSLNTRPMIFSPNDKLEIKVVSDDHQAGITIDGQVNLPLVNTSGVVITKADFQTNFIVFPENTFYKVLRNKLHWGFPPSNS